MKRFTVTLTQNNLSDSNKIIISLNKEEKDSLLWGINFKSTYQWSNKFHHDDIKNLIKKFL